MDKETKSQVKAALAKDIITVLNNPESFTLVQVMKAHKALVDIKIIKKLYAAKPKKT